MEEGGADCGERSGDWPEEGGGVGRSNVEGKREVEGCSNRTQQLGESQVTKRADSIFLFARA